MSNAARKNSTVGEIVNLMAIDAQQIMDITGTLNLVWSAPWQIFMAIGLLWSTLGEYQVSLLYIP